jgi:hypothetical protein
MRTKRYTYLRYSLCHRYRQMNSKKLRVVADYSLLKGLLRFFSESGWDGKAKV